jgi:Rrf2 family protein
VTIITRKSDYATRVLLHLAALPPGSWTTARQIAEQQSIPSQLVGQIVSQLAKADLVLSRRGRGGGIRMARQPAEISLLDVVEAVQGPLELNVCSNEPARCARSSECPMHYAWRGAQGSLVTALRGETLDKLVSRDAEQPAARRGRAVKS